MPFKILTEQMNLVMDTYGTPLRYYQGRLCSCVAENGGSFDPKCKCNQGYYYKNAVEIYGTKTNISSKYYKSQIGRIFDGGAQITIPKIYKGKEQIAHTTLAHGDIIVDPNKNRRDTDILIKGVRDYIYAFDVKSILSVYVKEKEYINGIDFTTKDVNSVAGKVTRIKWENTADIDEGKYYTVEFICNEQYIVYEDGGNRRGVENTDLPRKVICTLRRYAETNEDSGIIDDISTNQDF